MATGAKAPRRARPPRGRRSSRPEKPSVYPNAPVRRVVFEISFPVDVAIEGRRHELWKRVKAAYPQVLVPHLQPGAAPSLAPYLFQRQDNSSALSVALNAVALQADNYRGHQAFAKEFGVAYKTF